MLIVRTGGAEVGALERRRVEREVRARRELHAAAGAPPVSGDRGQARDGAHGHPAAGVTLQAVVHADERRLRAVRTRSRQRRRSSRSGVPVIAADARRRPLRARARAAARRRACTARGSRGPRARARTARASSRARARRRCPGGSAIHSSHCAAVRVRIGSMQMIARAVLARLEHERPEVRVRRERVRPPQQHEIALGMPSPSAPMFAPTVMRIPTVPAIEQIVRSSCDAPSVMEEPAVHRRALQQTHRAGVRVRQDRLRTVARRAIAPSRSPISVRALSHEMRSNRPLPLAPTRRSGVASRSS